MKLTKLHLEAKDVKIKNAVIKQLRDMAETAAGSAISQGDKPYKIGEISLFQSYPDKVKQNIVDVYVAYESRSNQVAVYRYDTEQKHKPSVYINKAHANGEEIYRSLLHEFIHALDPSTYSTRNRFNEPDLAWDSSSPESIKSYFAQHDRKYDHYLNDQPEFNARIKVYLHDTYDYFNGLFSLGDALYIKDQCNKYLSLLRNPEREKYADYDEFFDHKEFKLNKLTSENKRKFFKIVYNSFRSWVEKWRAKYPKSKALTKIKI